MKRIVQRMSDGTHRFKDAIGLKEFSQWQKTLTSTANQLQAEIGTPKLNSAYGKHMMEATNAMIKRDFKGTQKALTWAEQGLSYHKNPSALKLRREIGKMKGKLAIKDSSPEKNKKFEAIKKKMHKDYKTSYAIIFKGKLAGPDDISDQDLDKLYKQYVR